MGKGCKITIHWAEKYQKPSKISGTRLNKKVQTEEKGWNSILNLQTNSYLGIGKEDHAYIAWKNSL